ncbi:hypothetical protein [Kitasatospora sp. CB01950]|uniref:hypothetical protein n=1 Tax=Kitasatospora sp. CB01950 TaxID=1703930 RepID=UPI0011611C4E|nr:hypothetical protein [Kitasatospora sp. CB01950]
MEKLTALARAAESRYDLATVVLAGGDLGGDTRPWLTASHSGVRACATGEVRRSSAFFEPFGDMAPPLQLQFRPYPDRSARP